MIVEFMPVFDPSVIHAGFVHCDVPDVIRMPATWLGRAVVPWVMISARPMSILLSETLLTAGGIPGRQAGP